VHHDLSTVADYFDRVFLMNVRAIAEGTVAEAFTTENLQAAYGGRLETDHVARLSVPADRGHAS
jgi:manganese/zinc/iron transport system ATP- binding protein